MKMQTVNNDYINLLKPTWKQSLPRFTNQELIQIFPEAKTYLKQRLQEYKQKEKNIQKEIKNELIEIRNSHHKNNQWFWREWLKVDKGQDLIETEKEISKIQFILAKPSKGNNKSVTEKEINHALNIPIESLTQNLKLRKTGESLTGLCPLHNEKFPSFHIYPKTNSFYCYGCQKGGNTINLVRELHNFNFKETVEFLNNYN